MDEKTEKNNMEYLKSYSSRDFTLSLNSVIDAIEAHPEFITYLLNARRSGQNQAKICSKFVVNTADGLRFLVGFMKSFHNHPITNNIIDGRNAVQNVPPVTSDSSIDLAAALKFVIDTIEQIRNDKLLNPDQHTDQDNSQNITASNLPICKTEEASIVSASTSNLSSHLEALSVSENTTKKIEETKLQQPSQEPNLSVIVETDKPSSRSGNTSSIEPSSKPNTLSYTQHKKVPPKDYRMCMTRFYGSKGDDANDFIVTLEAYKDWGQISDEQTYNELHTLLVGNALEWWKKHKHIGYINSWRDAKREMRIMFTKWPPHRIFKELIKNKQGNQPSQQYFRKVEALLEKLPEDYISEAAKVDLVYSLASDKIRMRIPRCAINDVKDFGIHGYYLEGWDSIGVIRREVDFLYMRSTGDTDTESM